MVFSLKRPPNYDLQRSPGHQMEAGLLAEILVGRSATRCRPRPPRAVRSTNGRETPQRTSRRFQASAKLLNHHIIALGARLARYLRPELKAKSIRNLFRCAFERACPNLPVSQVRRDDDSAFPEFLKGFREDRDISVERHMWGLRGMPWSREPRPRRGPISTCHGPCANIAPCRANAGIGAIAGVRDFLFATCLRFVGHRFRSLFPGWTSKHHRHGMLSRPLFPAIRPVSHPSPVTRSKHGISTAESYGAYSADRWRVARLISSQPIPRSQRPGGRWSGLPI